MLYAGVNKVSKTLCFNRLSSLGKELWHFDQFSLLLSRTVHISHGKGVTLDSDIGNQKVLLVGKGMKTERVFRV